MELTLSYEAEQPSLPIQFLIGIYDDLNTRVLFLDSFTVKGLPVSYPDVGTLRLKFDDNFSLFPGTYTMNMAVVVHGENADYIQNAIALRVEEGDFFGTGKLPRAKASVLYRNDWQLLS